MLWNFPPVRRFDVATVLTVECMVTAREIEEQRPSGVALTPSEAASMQMILVGHQRGEAVRPSDLGRSLGCTTGRVSVILNGLENAGLITRERPREDRRTRVIRPTAAAQRLQQSA